MNYQRLNYPNGYKKIVGQNKGCPMQPIPQMPTMPNTKQAPLPMMPNNNLPKLNLFPIDKGYLKGTIYRGLYQPYRNLIPAELVFSNEQEKLLFDVNKNHFGMTELGFYLNNFPDDKEALKKFNEFRMDYLAAKNAYESKYGALSWSSQQLERSPWNWVQTLAPWKKGD
jgi:spore coat protein JB